VLLAALIGHGVSQTAPKQAAQTAPRQAARAQQGTAKPNAGAEQILFDAVNRERRAKNLRALAWSPQLATAARGHARRMARENRISHQFAGQADFASRIRSTGFRFRGVAENVAQGPDAAGIHRQWMNSPPHRANIMDPEMDSMGIGVAERQGQIFAVQDFGQRAE
jgi:uncharacterized protein YkwD